MWTLQKLWKIMMYIYPFLAIVQKRLKKEKKAKRKLQEALEFETKRREQAEQTLKQATSTDSLRVLNGKRMCLYAWLTNFHCEYSKGNLNVFVGLDFYDSWFIKLFLKAWWKEKSHVLGEMFYFMGASTVLLLQYLTLLFYLTNSVCTET